MELQEDKRWGKGKQVERESSNPRMGPAGRQLWGERSGQGAGQLPQVLLDWGLSYPSLEASAFILPDMHIGRQVEPWTMGMASP